MAIAILSKEMRLEKPYRSKIEVGLRKKEFSMTKRRSALRDYVTAKTRLTTPFHYRLLKLKIKLFGLNAYKELFHANKG